LPGAFFVEVTGQVVEVMHVVVKEIVTEIFVREPLLDGDTEIKVHGCCPGVRKGEVKGRKFLSRSKRPASKACG
jgi:hypothetical protein